MYCADWYGRPVLGYQQFMSSHRACECKLEIVLVFHQTNPYLLTQIIYLPMAPSSMSYSHLALNTIFAGTPRHNIIVSVRSAKTLNVVLLTAHSSRIKRQARRQNLQILLITLCIPLCLKKQCHVLLDYLLPKELICFNPQVTSTCSLLQL